MTNRAKALAVAAGAVVLVALGLLYLLWSSARVDRDIAERSERAQEAIEAFEQNEQAGDADGGDSVAAPGDDTPDVGQVDDVAEGDGAVIQVGPTPTTGPTPAADERGPAVGPEPSVGPVPLPGEVLVIHRVPGDDYGRLAIRHADGSRTLLDKRCVRVHVAGDEGVCLAEQPDLLGLSWQAEFFDASDGRFEVYRSYPSPLPSRVRVSPDGARVSVTGFVSGSSYADVGSGTETLATIDETGDEGRLIGLVQFEVDHPDPRYDGADRQFWGVSWADADVFWVTGFFGEEPEIMTGEVASRTLTPTGWNGSCPSLSPGGETVIYKATQPDGSFRLTAVDLESQRRWELGETRSVDDQVEWLDDDTILYALHPEGTDGTEVEPQFDIWTLDIAEGAEPELFLPAANSPAVVRG